MVHTLPLLFISRLVSASPQPASLCRTIADITPPENAQAFGMIGMAFSINYVVAPAIGGVLGECVAAILDLYLPQPANYCKLARAAESPPLDRRAPFRWSKRTRWPRCAC